MVILLTVPVLAGNPVSDCQEQATQLAVGSRSTGTGVNNLDRQVAVLIRWIDEATSYDVSSTRTDPPEIVFTASGGLIEYEQRQIVVEPNLRGAYDLSHRRIYLVCPWTSGNPRNVATLLHELVHDIQFQTRSWQCSQAAEWEAYQLQERWLVQQGIAADFNWVQILMLARCPRDLHW